MPNIASFLDDGLGHTSYLVDLGDGTALVIDPARLPDQQIAEAARRGLRIAYTADCEDHSRGLVMCWAAGLVISSVTHRLTGFVPFE